MPLPAKIVLARAMGSSVEEAGKLLSALIVGGYGIAPREPSNGMLKGYIEATCPPTNHEQIMTAIGKARLRWQAMLDSGTAMAMSVKYIPEDLQAISTEQSVTETCPKCDQSLTHISAIGPACLNKECPVSDDASLWRDQVQSQDQV